MQDDVKTVAQSLLRTSARCSHCNGTAELEYLDDGLIAAHVCPGRYVSRMIEYGKELDPKKFTSFVQKACEAMGTVESGDVRIASRYAWDLGLDRQNNDLILKEAYWTQNYRRTKNDGPHRPALFLCSNRDSMFVQPLDSNETLCQECRKKGN